MVEIAYWSGTGNTEAMASEIEAAVKAAGADVESVRFEDTTVDDVAGKDVILLGCPAMGSEVLEDMEFEPMFDGCKSSLKGKRVALFGSYGWGGGEWMHNWERDCRSAGIRPIMITGDHVDTASAIARELGLLGPGDEAVTGAELQRMDEQQLRRTVRTASVFARVAPELGEWAAFFDALALKRRAVEAGAVGLVTGREADDLIRDAHAFAGAAGVRVAAHG